MKKTQVHKKAVHASLCPREQERHVAKWVQAAEPRATGQLLEVPGQFCSAGHRGPGWKRGQEGGPCLCQEAGKAAADDGFRGCIPVTLGPEKGRENQTQPGAQS